MKKTTKILLGVLISICVFSIVVFFLYRKKEPTEFITLNTTIPYKNAKEIYETSDLIVKVEVLDHLNEKIVF